VTLSLSLSRESSLDAPTMTMSQAPNVCEAAARSCSRQDHASGDRHFPWWLVNLVDDTLLVRAAASQRRCL